MTTCEMLPGWPNRTCQVAPLHRALDYGIAGSLSFITINIIVLSRSLLYSALSEFRAGAHP